MIDRFNIRVYFLLIENNRVLVADEIIKKKPCVKFPGGGLEFGESTIDCCIREAMEELNQPIEVGAHFYTTEIFQQSAFRETDQVLSIYYFAKMIGEQQFTTSHQRFNFKQHENDEEAFRWVDISALNEEPFTFPIDKLVAEKLRKHHQE